MTTCKTCKHWGEHYDRNHPYQMPCKMIREKLYIDIGGADGWVDGVETDPDFGCNLWEQYKP